MAKRIFQTTISDPDVPDAEPVQARKPKMMKSLSSPGTRRLILKANIAQRIRLGHVAPVGDLDLQLARLGGRCAVWHVGGRPRLGT